MSGALCGVTEMVNKLEQLGATIDVTIAQEESTE
jgi:hypothetical protein